MKRQIKKQVFPFTIGTIALGLCLPFNSLARNAEAQGGASATTSQTQPSGTSAAARAESQAQAQPNMEKQRMDAEQNAQGTVDKDAIAAVEETQNAVKAIADGKTDEAIAAIERASGKINILVARKPAAALIPVDVEVQLIDTAPRDTVAIQDIARQAEEAMDEKDYPQARLLLDGLTSEIRVRTYHLPLATYPLAMQEAARLLDQNKTKEASTVLTTALNTLVVIDRGTPLPVELAQAAVTDAQAQREKDKAAAQKLLATAKEELERAKVLGYAGEATEYASLNNSIADLDKQLNGAENTTSAFAKLKETISAFVHRLSDSEKKSDSNAK